MAARPKIVKERNAAADAEEKAAAEKADAEVSGKVQEQINKEQEQGFRGVEVDPTPNENYTLSGVIAGKPTPETDRDAAERAATAHRRGF